ncbi:amidohydrolase family protein [Streptomyces sp. NPDC013187]|uniref:amidohydrolase family protein n=1 Tax=Streptomyces sp. NPDC013187 TaxID=3364865 RepID=UPI0036C58868
MLLPHQQDTDHVRRALRNLRDESPALVGRTHRAQQSYWYCTPAGLRLSSASDAPVTFPAWLQGVMAMRLREGMFGGVAGKAERISVPEALATYTRAPAWQDHAARWKGTLQQGQAADICVLDGDVMRVDPHDLIVLKVAATMVGGTLVYDGGSASARPARGVAAHAGSLSKHSSTACLDEGLCCCAVTERLGG